MRLKKERKSTKILLGKHEGFQTSADEERATRFPFPNPSPRAENGKEKSGVGAPKEVWENLFTK